MPLKVGFASEDITPSLPVTTSGFISRCNKPVDATRDPLHLRCMVFEYNRQKVILLVYDLLGLGNEIHSLIQDTLDETEDIDIPRTHRILGCTHTHSAPSTVELLGCGIPDKSYWQQLCNITRDTCLKAMKNTKSVTISRCEVPMDGLAYDRTYSQSRTIATLGEMPRNASSSVPDKMYLIKFDDKENNPLAGIIHWAAHPVLSGGDRISADYPGELCKKLGEKFNMPFLFLQGAAGNLNPPLVPGSDDSITNYDTEILNRAESSFWTEPEECKSFGFAESMVPLDYMELFSQGDLRQLSRDYQKAASNKSPDSQIQQEISKVLNTETDDETQQTIIAHTCEALSNWAANWAVKPQAIFYEPCEVNVKALNLGGMIWYFIAAEPYFEIQEKLQKSFPGNKVHVIGFSSPLKGYIPVFDEDRTDGYEIEYAFRFYNHPAPFAENSNEKMLKSLINLTSQIT
ncbi:MAG: hypothetical protein WD059_12645 [Balneolaceae bacterium]